MRWIDVDEAALMRVAKNVVGTPFLDEHKREIGEVVDTRVSGRWVLGRVELNGEGAKRFHRRFLDDVIIAVAERR